MSLKTLDAPCWRLTRPDGTDYGPEEGPTHYDDEAAARKAIADYHTAGDGYNLAPKRWPTPCVLMVCDGCGADPDDGTFAHVHFPDERSAELIASVYDYDVDADAAGAKTVLCEDCAWKRDLAAEEADEDDD